MGGREQHRERRRQVPERRARLAGGPASRLVGIRGEHEGSSGLHNPRLRRTTLITRNHAGYLMPCPAPDRATISCGAATCSSNACRPSRVSRAVPAPSTIDMNVDCRKAGCRDAARDRAAAGCRDDRRDGLPRRAASGVPDVLRRAGGTSGLVPTLLADKVCGLVLTYSIIAALFHRERTGEGQHVEVPMTDAMQAFLLVE